MSDDPKQKPDPRVPSFDELKGQKRPAAPPSRDLAFEEKTSQIDPELLKQALRQSQQGAPIDPPAKPPALAISASGGGSVDVGGTANFTATATNNGPNDAAFTGVALVFNALVNPTVTAPAGWACTAPSQAGSTTTVTCTIGTFANGGSATFSAAVPADAALGDTALAMAAAITSQYTDPNPGNNNATAFVTVRAVTEVEYFVIDNAIDVLHQHPDWLLQIARLLAQRVNATTALLTRDKSEEPSLVLPQNFMSSWGDPTV